MMKSLLSGATAAALLLTANAGLAGLVAYYSFDSGFTDGSGSGNDLTVSNGTPDITTVAGETVFGGGALNLTGSDNEWLSLGTPLTFGASDPWSVSFWARRTGGATEGMVMGNGGVRNSFIWGTDNFNGMRFRPQSSASASNDFTAPKDDNYHHFVIVADGTGALTLYVDGGAPETKPSATGGTSFTINAVGHAYDSLGLSFDGQIDELHIFDEAIDAAKVTELFIGGPDETAPTLADITDDRAGGPVEPGSLVTYTVTFSEDMDASTVTAADFSNAGSAAYSIGTVTEPSPGSFLVPVTPNAVGTLQLQIQASAVLADTSGNELDTSSALSDDTTLSVEVDTIAPTLAPGDMLDDQGGGPVAEGTTVTYTLSFSEDIDESTVDAGDFGNAGSANVTIGTITETSPGVFTVEVTPSSDGSLQLAVLAGAVIQDFAGNPLDTGSAIAASGTLTVFEAPTPADVTLLRVVFVAGQSNADGRAAASGLPTSPVNLQQPQEDVDFFYRVEGTIFPLTTLRPGLSETSGFGPAVTCGRRLADELANGITTRVAVIKYANGGTNLHTQWAGGGDATTTGDGSQYVRFQQTVTAGLAALSSTYPNASIELLGLVWLQGESDAGSAGNAAAYEANLTNFIADLRLTYGADLRFVVIRLSDGQTAINAANLATVRAAQAAVAAADPLTGMVDSDGFGMKGDNLHFDATGQQQNGHAAAIQLLNLYPYLSQPLMEQVNANTLRITVSDAFDGFLYSLQSSPTMQAGSWSTVDSVTGGTNAVFTPTISGDQQFFRVGRTIAP